jgi:tRNA (mo5U34)-methyltransferase
MIGSEGRMTTAQLREEVIRLGPWHIDIDVTAEVSTRVWQEAPAGAYAEELANISFYRPNGFPPRLRRIFPDGLAGRSVLDSACNCGAHLFYAKEAGAGPCVGLDVRRHWIDQARFLAEHRHAPTDEMNFEVADLHDIPELGLGTFDVSFFSGIFYHLPDPVTALKIVAERTGELLLVRTATMPGYPDGLLVFHRESTTHPMSGTSGIGWFPTGPVILTRILHWLGFPEVRCSLWRRPPKRHGDHELLEVLAARRPGYFDAWDSARPAGAAGAAEVIESLAPPGATVFVDGGGELPDPHSRRAVRLPAGGALRERLDHEGRLILDDGAYRVLMLDGNTHG